jgi:hypothetical protein
MLDLYTDYLISSTGQVSATVLSQMTDGEISDDKITRFLHDDYLDSKELWKHAKPLIGKSAHPDGVLIVDDCIAEKEHTDENAIIYASMLAFIKLEKLKCKTNLGHFQLKARLYLHGLKAMNRQLQLCSA